MGIVSVAAFLGPGGFLLGGCGGTLPDESGSPRSFNGTVNLRQVGGSGLKVSNSLVHGQFIGSDGSFSAALPVGAQWLAVTDDAGRLRASAITPGAKAGSPPNLSIDAQSTALAVLMLTPGIAASDPELFRARKSYFEGLDSFRILEGRLADVLPSRSVHEALDLPEIAEALEACVAAFCVRFLDSPGRGIGADGAESDIELSVTQPESARTEIEVRNRAWRYVRVGRHTSDAANATVSVKDFGVMGGAVPLSLGSVFTLTATQPEIWKDVECDYSSYSRADYAFQGLGLSADRREPLPVGVAQGYADAALKSVIMYVVFPLIDILVGIAGALNKVKAFVEIIWASVTGGVSVGDLLDAGSEGNWRRFASAIIDLAVAVISIALTTGVLVSAGILSAPKAAALGVALGIVAVGFGVLNGLVASYYYLSLPDAHVMSARGTGSGVVVVS